MIDYFQGSSPRVRGAVHRKAIIKRLAGIIPARAGSSAKISLGRRLRRDHPRACGEQFLSNFLRKSSMGSSPRVRGAEARHAVDGVAVGIIPARAGSRSCHRRRPRHARDHPRACGEQLSRRGRHAVETGSSPRVRGAVRPVRLS